MPLRCARCAKKRAWLQTAIDILLFLHNNPGATPRAISAPIASSSPRWFRCTWKTWCRAAISAAKACRRTGRKCRLLLTAQALPVVEKGLALQAAFTAQMFAGLSKEDLASGQRCLAAVTQNIQAINQKGSA